MVQYSTYSNNALRQLCNSSTCIADVNKILLRAFSAAPYIHNTCRRIYAYVTRTVLPRLNTPVGRKDLYVCIVIML